MRMECTTCHQCIWLYWSWWWLFLWLYVWLYDLATELVEYYWWLWHGATWNKSVNVCGPKHRLLRYFMVNTDNSISSLASTYGQNKSAIHLDYKFIAIGIVKLIDGTHAWIYVLYQLGIYTLYPLGIYALYQLVFMYYQLEFIYYQLEFMHYINWEFVPYFNWHLCTIYQLKFMHYINCN